MRISDWSSDVCSSDLFDRPKHPYTSGLLACMPNSAMVRHDGGRRRLTPIPGTVPSILALPEGCTFAPRCPLAEEACRTAVPGLVPAVPGHLTRCRRNEAL